MTGNTKFLDLDAVDMGAEVVIKLQGIEHKLKPVSVGDFIANTKLVQGLGVATDVETEVQTIITMLITSPLQTSEGRVTMTREMLIDLPIAALNKMFAFAQENNGTQKVEEEAKAEAEANPQPAGA